MATTEKLSHTTCKIPLPLAATAPTGEPLYTAKDFAFAFGENYYTAPGLTAGAVIPLNALYASAQELSVFSIQDQDHENFLTSLSLLSERMLVAARIGHTELLAMAARIVDLEKQLAANGGAQ